MKKVNDNAANERLTSKNTPLRASLQKSQDLDKDQMIKLNTMTAV